MKQKLGIIIFLIILSILGFAVYQMFIVSSPSKEKYDQFDNEGDVIKEDLEMFNE